MVKFPPKLTPLERMLARNATANSPPIRRFSSRSLLKSSERNTSSPTATSTSAVLTSFRQALSGDARAESRGSTPALLTSKSSSGWRTPKRSPTSVAPLLSPLNPADDEAFQREVDAEVAAKAKAFQERLLKTPGRKAYEPPPPVVFTRTVRAPPPASAPLGTQCSECGDCIIRVHSPSFSAYSRLPSLLPIARVHCPRHEDHVIRFCQNLISVLRVYSF